MKRNNLNSKEFVIYSIFLNIIVYLVYRNCFFKTVENMSIDGSQGILGIIVLVASVINFFVTKSWGKNEKAVLATTFSAYGIYTYIAYSEIVKSAYMCISVITVIIMIVYLALLFGHNISNTNKRKIIIRNRHRRGYEGVRNIVACAGVAFTIIAFVQRW